MELKNVLLEKEEHLAIVTFVNNITNLDKKIIEVFNKLQLRL